MLLRKEWRKLTQVEKTTYTSAVVKLQNQKGSQQGTAGVGYYAKVHQQYGQRGIHWTAMFLPWHRYVTRHYELALRKLVPNAVQHYWDASLDHEDYWSAPIFGKGDDTFGGMGSGRRGCVADGPFKNFKPYSWSCLERSTTRNANISAPALVHETISSNQKYWDFAREFEVGFHAQVHVAAGGIMLKSFFSPNEPLFFVHHSNCDRLWAIWQLQSPSRLMEYGGSGSNPTLERLDSKLLGFNDVSIRDVMDIKKLCYTFDDLSTTGRKPPTTPTPRPTTPRPRRPRRLSPRSEDDTDEEESNEAAKAKVEEYHLGEIVSIRYPMEIPDEWIKMHGADKDFVRKVEARKRKIVDRLNALEGYVSPSCMLNRQRVLLKRIQENPCRKLTCTIRGKPVRITVGRNSQETLENLMQVRDDTLQAERKPTVKQLAAIIGKPCFTPNTLYNPFEACEK